MQRRAKQRERVSFSSATPVLITESKKDFEDLIDQIEQDLKPRGLIERGLVHRIASILWELRRYEGAKSAIINVAFSDALKNLLTQIGVEPDEVEDLTERWFTDVEAKAEVAEHLQKIGLDERAIEAEAICTSAGQLEPIFKTLSSLETRFRTAVVSLGEYREATAKLGGTSGRVIEGKQIEGLRIRSSAA
jgi:hypothetical protein